MLPLIYSNEKSTRDSLELRELMAVDDDSRDINWLRRMLQYAIQLEFTTIPPYLVAMWSIRDLGSPASLFLFAIVQQEMLHMGIVCNILNSIGGKPCIDSPHVVPTYPTILPGGINPDLSISLAPLSRELVSEVFMEIEKPEFGPIAFYRGQTYPTIGAFYSAIASRIQRLSADELSPQRQITLHRPDFLLDSVATVPDALMAIERIKEQGEGTCKSPGPSADEKAHYYLFAELYHEKMLVEVSPGRWTYSGDDIPFPTDSELYPLGPIPVGGYPESVDFDKTYTNMLHELQKAWDAGGDVGGAHLIAAMEFMGALGPKAIALMQTETANGGLGLCPCFRLIGDKHS